MKVWIVEGGAAYECFEIVAVCSSEMVASAIEFDTVNTGRYDSVAITEHEVVLE